MIKRESVKSRDQEDLFRHKLVNIIDMSWTSWVIKTDRLGSVRCRIVRTL